MKKRKIFFVLSLTALLFSCGNKGDTGPSLEDIGINVDKEIVDNNIPEEEASLVRTTRVNGMESKYTFSEENVLSISHEDLGLCVIKNDTDHIGFYSMQYGKFLVSPIYYKDWVTYSVIEDDNVGFFLKIYFEDETIVYDSLGNLLFQEKINPTSVSLSSRKVDDDVFVTVSSNMFSNVYYKYNTDGSVIEVPRIKESEHTTDNDSDFGFGDKYIDLSKIDLDEYGMEGYYFSRSGNLYTLFDNTNTKVCTFVVPENAKYIIVENSIICQEKHKMTQFDTNFDFIDRGEKYCYNSYSISLLDGSRTDMKLDYIILEGSSFKDAEGKYTLSLVSLQRINSDKCLESSELFLVDKEGVLQKNITGLSPTRFVKVGNNYYNEETKVLYDSELKEISYLGAINPILDKDNNLFFGRVDGLWGALDFDGNTVIPFEYEKIYREDIVNNKVIVQNGTKAYSYNLISGTTESIPGVTRKLFDGLYISESDEEILFFDTEYTVLDGVYDMNENHYVSNISYAHQELGLFDTEYYYVNTVERNKDSDGNITYEYTCRTFEIQDLPNSNSFSSIGEEITTQERLGKSEEDSILLEEGINKMHTPSYRNTIFEFTPSETNTFEFNFGNDNLSISSIYYYEQNELGQNVKKNVPINSRSVLGNRISYFDLQEDVKYFIVMSNNGSKTYYEKELFTAEGRDPIHAFEYTDAFESAEFAYNENTFIKFTAQATLEYDIEISEGFKVYLYDASNDVLKDIEFDSIEVTLSGIGSTKDCIFYVEKEKESQETTFTFTINPDVSGEAPGKTPYNPIDLNNLQSEDFSVNRGGICYFKYENTGETDINELIHLEFTSNSYYEEFEDNHYLNEVQDTLKYGTNLAIPVSLQPEEALYFAVGGSNVDVFGEIQRYDEDSKVERNEVFTVNPESVASYYGIFAPEETGTYKIALGENSKCTIYRYIEATNQITKTYTSDTFYLNGGYTYLFKVESTSSASFDSKITFAYETKAEVSEEKQTLSLVGNSAGYTYLTFNNDTESDKVYKLSIDPVNSSNTYSVVYGGIDTYVNSSSASAHVIQVIVPANSEKFVKFNNESGLSSSSLTYLIEEKTLIDNPTEQKALVSGDYGTFVFTNTSEQKKTYLLGEKSGTNNVIFIVYDSEANKLFNQTNDLSAQQNIFTLNPNEKIYISYKASADATIELSFTDINPISASNEIAPNVETLNTFEVTEDGFYDISVNFDKSIGCVIYDEGTEIFNNNGALYEKTLFLKAGKLYIVNSKFTTAEEGNRTLSFGASKATSQVSEFVFDEYTPLFGTSRKTVYKYENDTNQPVSIYLKISSAVPHEYLTNENVTITGSQATCYNVTIAANSTGYILFNNGSTAVLYKAMNQPFSIDNSSYTNNFTYSDGIFESGNAGISSSSSKMKITVYASGTLSFYYLVSSENSYDYFNIYKNGVFQYRLSGTGQTSYSFKQYSVSSGDVIELEYAKDSTNDYGTDSVKIKNITFSF